MHYACAYIYPEHPEHPEHASNDTGFRRSWCILARGAHGATYFLFKKMEKIRCGPENVQGFNRRLRELFPEFHALAKELHSAGLISGLAGATIETDIDPDEHDADYASEAVKVCSQCRYWIKDGVGDGTGIGICEKGAMPAKIKWPGQTACKLFGEISND